MPLDLKPVQRKVIVPWYDSETACLILIVLSSILVLFGAAGVSVVRENPEFKSFRWFPFLLSTLGAAMVVMRVIRLVRQMFSRYQDR